MAWLLNLLRAIFRRRPAPVPQPDPGPTPAPGPNPEILGALLALHNQSRAKSGSLPLVASPALNKTAQGHADWMARNNDLDHYEPGNDPFQRIRSAGYPEGSENIAEGQRSAAEAVSDWLSDPPHARNVLNPHWHEVGFGVAASSAGVGFWCADYGTKSALTVGLSGEEIGLPGGVRRIGDKVIPVRVRKFPE